MKKIAILSDFHCGHKVGLTPRGYLPEQPVEERSRWVEANRAYYNWYNKNIRLYGPYDIVFINGDLVDGRGAKSGGTELITTDMEEQCDMAVRLIREIPKAKNCKIVITRGTPYHTGNEEDWENNIAMRVDAAIGEHEWVDVEGVVFDLKHHPAGSSNVPHGRHSAVARDRLWNIMWAEKQLQPKADIFIRSHVHYHNFSGGPDWLAMTTPALQGFGCLTAGHKILTDDLKWVNVETLKAGDKLLAFEEEPTNKRKRNFVLSEVLANEPIKQHVYDVLLSDGTKITATGNHPFLTQLSNNQYKWRTVIDLKNNLDRSKTKRIVFKRFMPVWEEDKSYEGGYLSGFFDSEGCLCQAKHSYNGNRIMVDGYQNVITAKQKGNPCYDFAIKCLESLGIKYSIGKHKNCHTFRICGGLTNILMFLGKIRPKRLLEQLEIEKLGSMRNSEKNDNLKIVSIEYAGEQIVWGLGTSSKTYISDGFLSHNSRYGARRCTGIVDFGFVTFTVNKGTYTWQPVIAHLEEQKAPMLKL